MAKFKRIRKICEDFDKTIEGLSDDELRKLIQECRNLTQKNCWFLLYEMREIVMDRAKAYLHTHRVIRADRKDGGEYER